MFWVMTAMVLSFTAGGLAAYLALAAVNRRLIERLEATVTDQQQQLDARDEALAEAGRKNEELATALGEALQKLSDVAGYVKANMKRVLTFLAIEKKFVRVANVLYYFPRVAAQVWAKHKPAAIREAMKLHRKRAKQAA